MAATGVAAANRLLLYDFLESYEVFLTVYHL